MTVTRLILDDTAKEFLSRFPQGLTIIEGATSVYEVAKFGKAITIYEDDKVIFEKYSKGSIDHERLIVKVSSPDELSYDCCYNNETQEKEFIISDNKGFEFHTDCIDGNVYYREANILNDILDSGSELLKGRKIVNSRQSKYVLKYNAKDNSFRLNEEKVVSKK
jgi:hypothetical protein